MSNDVTNIESNVDIVELSLDDYSDGVELVIEDGDTAPKGGMPKDAIYPCAVIEGLTTEYEVEFLKKHSCEPDVSIPLYINFDGLILLLGNIELTLDYLLTIRYLDVSKLYKLKIYKSADVIVEVDLNDANQLANFIKLG